MLHDAVELKSGANQKGPDAVSWICTAVTLAGYLALMLGVAYAPGMLSQPLIEGSLLTVGIAGGVFAILLLIVVSAVYTHWRNAGER